MLALLEKDPAARPATTHEARAMLAPLSGRALGAAPPLQRPLRASFVG